MMEINFLGRSKAMRGILAILTLFMCANICLGSGTGQAAKQYAILDRKTDKVLEVAKGNLNGATNLTPEQFKEMLKEVMEIYNGGATNQDLKIANVEGSIVYLVGKSDDKKILTITINLSNIDMTSAASIAETLAGNMAKAIMNMKNHDYENTNKKTTKEWLEENKENGELKDGTKNFKKLIKQKLEESKENKCLGQQMIDIDDDNVIMLKDKAKKTDEIVISKEFLTKLKNYKYQEIWKQVYADVQKNPRLRLFYKAQGVEQNHKEAANWYKKAAQQGHADAQNNLGEMYYKGDGVEQNHKEAMNWFKKAAQQGHADAQYNLGWMYYKAKGTEQNYTEAANWFKKAAEQGHAYAQNNLSVMYYDGKGVEQSHKEATKWYNAKAQYHLGAMYINGKVVQQNYREAMRRYKNSAKQGDAKAQNNLGASSANRKGLEQNYKKAKKAAKQGDVQAQYNLGLMYYNGEGVEQNYKEAMKWFKKAAKQGDADAQNNLGHMFEYGI